MKKVDEERGSGVPNQLPVAESSQEAQDPAEDGLFEVPVQWEADGPRQRRKTVKWSRVEEEALRAGVATYGIGKWKIILAAYPATLAGRTVVDLKDKWRTLGGARAPALAPAPAVNKNEEPAAENANKEE